MISSARKTFLFIIAAVLISAIPARAKNILDKIQWKTEKHFGYATVAEMEQTYGFVKDPLVVDYINRLGNAIAEKSHRTDIPYSFYVVDTDEINAFAAPGGFVFVTRGLIEKSDSEEEIASVMAHEIGHVAAKHGAKQVKKMPIILAGSIALSANTDESTSRIIGTAFSLMQLHYSREDEYQADSLGVVYSTAAGYDPRGMISFFRKLEEEHPSGNLSRMDVALSSHPKTPSRINRAASMNQLADTSGNLAAACASYSKRFYPNEAVDMCERALRLQPDNAAAAAELGSALLMLGRSSEAVEWFDLAHRLNPDFLPPDSAADSAVVDSQQAPAPLDSDRFFDDSDLAMASSNLSAAANMAAGFSASREEDFQILDKASDDIYQSLLKNWKTYSDMAGAFNPRIDPRGIVMGSAVANIRDSLAVMDELKKNEATLNDLSVEYERFAREMAWRLANSPRANAGALDAAGDLSEAVDRFSMSRKVFVDQTADAAKSVKSVYDTTHRSISDISDSISEKEAAQISYIASRLEPRLEEGGKELAATEESIRAAAKDLALQKLALKRAVINFNSEMLSPAEEALFTRLLSRRFGVEDSLLRRLRAKNIGFADIMLLISKSQRDRRKPQETLAAVNSSGGRIENFLLSADADATGGSTLLKLMESDILSISQRRPLIDLEPEPVASATAIIAGFVADDPLLLSAAQAVDAAEYEKAIQLLKDRGAKLKPTAGSHIVLGMAQMGMDDFESASDNFKRSLKKDNRNIAAHILLADSFKYMKRFEDARNEYAAALVIEPENPAALAAFAHSLALEGRMEDALAAYEKAAANPSYARPSLFTNIGLLYYRKGFMEEAIKAFTKSLELDPAQTRLAKMLRALLST